ncbi:MAG: HD domain-containing protein [Clostridia bacterium]|nr:HD domain-containing protein [Clostridia bacterium]
MITLTEHENSLLNDMKKSSQETYGHSVRVGKLTREMIRIMNASNVSNFSSREVDIICKGALLHDIGKLYIKNDIITKKTALSKEEMGYMISHTVRGYKAIKNDLAKDEHDMIKNICLYHHERIDGNGYEGKTELPLYVQIVSVCDVFDAIHSNRSYHRGLPTNECMEIIKKGESGAFDEMIIYHLEQTVKEMGI